MRELPGLAEALSAPAMAPRLQRMLADDWELLGCSPGKAFVEPGDGATVQYRLELRRRDGGADGGAPRRRTRCSRRWRRRRRWLSRLEPLADQLAGRDDLRAFVRPALLVPRAAPRPARVPARPRAARAWCPPPTLRRSCRSSGRLLTGSVPGLLLQDCHIEVVRYRRGSCVLRYELAWSLQPSRRSLKQVVYGKVYGDEQGRLVGPAVSALRHLQEAPGPALPFQVPRFQAYLPDLRLTLLEAVPGAPLLPALIRARAGTPAFPGLTARARRSARAPGSPPLCTGRRSRSGAPARSPTRSPRRGRASTPSHPLAPALAASLHRHLGAIDALGLDAPGPLGVAHGDFDTSQVLFDGPTTSLVDFDTVCLAEPALDLGRFTGHLAAAVRRAPGAAGTRTPTATGTRGRLPPRVPATRAPRTTSPTSCSPASPRTGPWRWPASPSGAGASSSRSGCGPLLALLDERMRDRRAVTPAEAIG